MSVQPCGSATPPEHGVVQFEPDVFKEQFPQFVGVPDATLQLYFDLATLILNNTCRSGVSDAKMRERLLYLLVAHIATLAPTAASGNGPGSGGGLVGAITSATEGTVSVSAGWAGQVSQNAVWFMSTNWGALFWQLISPWRTFRYIAPRQCCGPAGAFAGRRGY